MLTESFIAATLTSNKPSANLSAALKDVGIFQYEFQPQNTLRHGYKKSSVQPQCLAISETHIYASQVEKAVINVYSRDKGNHEATVPFPEKIHSLAYADRAAVLIIGTEGGRLILWEVGTGRISTSASSHLESITSLCVTRSNDHIISGSADTNIHIWSLSNLVSLTKPNTSQNSNETPLNSSISTFSIHRTGITALACGNSASDSTNFVVSTSADSTCYVWHLRSCQILRTVLLPVVPLCISLDPADRAIYLGCEDGSIQDIDLFSAASKSSKRSLLDHSEAAPIQITTEESWTPPSNDVGAAQCLTLSYDGTALISGHAGGSIIRWDVAKHRVISGLTNLNQPVTNIHMLTPDGLYHNKSQFCISTIVKPRLGLDAESTDSTIEIPPSYALQAQVIRPSTTNRSQMSTQDETQAALTSNSFPQSLLDSALAALSTHSSTILTSNGTTAISDSSDSPAVSQTQVSALRKQVAFLEAQVAEYEEQSRSRRGRQTKKKKKHDVSDDGDEDEEGEGKQDDGMEIDD